MVGRRGRFSTGLALVALMALPSVASAEPPPASIHIIDRDTGEEQIRDGEPLVCEFAIELDFETDGVLEDVGWKIKVFTDDPFAGETVANADDGPTDEEGRLRQPREGWVSLPDGRYNLIVDDEYPPDASALFRSFTVECAEEPTPTPTPTATPTPAPTETTAPTPTPTPPPQGGVETPTPQPTLPPTDMADRGGPDGSRSVPVILLVLGVLTLGVLALTPAHRPRRPH